MRELAYKNQKSKKCQFTNAWKVYIFILRLLLLGFTFWLGECKPIMFLLVDVVPIYILGLDSDAHVSVLCTSEKLLVV